MTHEALTWKIKLALIFVNVHLFSFKRVTSSDRFEFLSIFFFPEVGSSQPGLELTVILLQPAEGWDYRYATPHLTLSFHLEETLYPRTA